MSISNCDSSPGERKDRGPGEQWVNGRADILEARERCFQSVVPTRKAWARFLLLWRMEGGQDYTTYSWKHRPEGAVSSSALFPNPKGRAETRSPTGEVTGLNLVKFLVRVDAYL